MAQGRGACAGHPRLLGGCRHFLWSLTAGVLMVFTFTCVDSFLSLFLKQILVMLASTLKSTESRVTNSQCHSGRACGYSRGAQQSKACVSALGDTEAPALLKP